MSILSKRAAAAAAAGGGGGDGGGGAKSSSRLAGAVGLLLSPILRQPVRQERFCPQPEILPQALECSAWGSQQSTLPTGHQPNAAASSRPLSWIPGGDSRSSTTSPTTTSTGYDVEFDAVLGRYVPSRSSPRPSDVISESLPQRGSATSFGDAGTAPIQEKLRNERAIKRYLQACQDAECEPQLIEAVAARCTILLQLGIANGARVGLDCSLSPISPTKRRDAHNSEAQNYGASRPLEAAAKESTTLLVGFSDHNFRGYNEPSVSSPPVVNWEHLHLMTFALNKLESEAGTMLVVLPDLRGKVHLVEEGLKKMLAIVEGRDKHSLQDVFQSAAARTAMEKMKIFLRGKIDFDHDFPTHFADPVTAYMARGFVQLLALLDKEKSIFDDVHWLAVYPILVLSA